jgi:glycosyltransferase involved in cell wall biosynthesis
MIVKDEEAVISRALTSAIPYINSWLIVDTGSSDNTKFIINTVLAGISGEIIDRPWVNFGHNRTEALELCKEKGMDWAIMLDADDNLAGTVPPSSIWSNENLDGFIMQIRHGSVIHQRVHIFHLVAKWIYEGVVHEYPRCTTKEKPTLGILPPETYMETRCEGARSRDPHKYLKDAALLEVELCREPTNGRTLFYLAQSYRDAGRPVEAMKYYKMHVELSGPVVAWAQEAYMSLVNLIGLGSETDLMSYGWRALELCPDRLEAQYFLMNRLRLLGHKPTQQLFALCSVTKGRKASRASLFVNAAVYDWGFDDEFAVVAFATGHYTESYAASTRCAINAPAVEMRENALRNLKITQDLMAC